MNHTLKRFPIGTRVKIHGGGLLRGLVVDYTDTRYMVAFPSGAEFILPEGILNEDK